MKAFVSSILGYDPKHQNCEGGILGLVKGYYGCVEAQGHGTLHCHMMVWVEGGLNLNVVRDRMISENDTEFAACLIQFPTKYLMTQALILKCHQQITTHAMYEASTSKPLQMKTSVSGTERPAPLSKTVSVPYTFKNLL